MCGQRSIPTMLYTHNTIQFVLNRQMKKLRSSRAINPICYGNNPYHYGLTNNPYQLVIYQKSLTIWPYQQSLPIGHTNNPYQLVIPTILTNMVMLARSTSGMFLRTSSVKALKVETIKSTSDCVNGTIWKAELRLKTTFMRSDQPLW